MSVYQFIDHCLIPLRFLMFAFIDVAILVLKLLYKTVINKKSIFNQHDNITHKAILRNDFQLIDVFPQGPVK